MPCLLDYHVQARISDVVLRRDSSPFGLECPVDLAEKATRQLDCSCKPQSAWVAVSNQIQWLCYLGVVGSESGLLKGMVDRSPQHAHAVPLS
jgi:hypothetical protein